MVVIRSGARILADQLVVHGVDTVFCVPGESYLDVLDALHDKPRIRVITCRHEAGAANMAEAYGKLTGRPGVCFVTRGPGATHASIGVHTARHDSTPVILFIGQVGRSFSGREAFQEVEFRDMFAPLAKWATQIDQPERVPETVSRGFHTAAGGRAGPVVIALPEDMLAERVEVPDAQPYHVTHARPSPDELTRMREAIERARRPIVIAGGGGWSADAARELQRFAEANRLPVTASFRRQDYLDNSSPSYAGHLGVSIDPALARRVRESDLVVALGTRLGEIPTAGYTLLEPPKPRQTLVHVHPEPDELGRVYRPDVAINAHAVPTISALADLPPVDAPWAQWTEDARRDFLNWQVALPANRGVDLGGVVSLLEKRLPAEAVIVNGAGNYTAWAQRFYTYTAYRTQLAPTSGAMGYSVPAAIAAGLVDPSRPVVCFAGDGCFLMSGQELATATQYGVKVVFLVVNNGMYGTIRMHQERRFPGRVIATDLVNPDFAAYARAFGLHSEVVQETDEFPAAFERAMEASGSALLELRVDPDVITPGRTIDQFRS